jgi:hypothetical protein
VKRPAPLGQIRPERRHGPGGDSQQMERGDPSAPAIMTPLLPCA